MLGMPVENHAAARSPQAMAIAGAPAFEVDTPPTMRKWHFLDHPIPPQPTAALAKPERFCHRARSAGAYGSSCVECQKEVGCVGQHLLEHCGNARRAAPA
jgi:hypothetical protein